MLWLHNIGLHKELPNKITILLVLGDSHIPRPGDGVTINQSGDPGYDAP